MNSLRETFEDLRETHTKQYLSEREQLIGSPLDMEPEERKTTQSLSRANHSLENSRRLLGEIEDIGLATLEELSEQRNRITSAQAKANEMRVLTNDARNIVRRMEKREKSLFYVW